jgi:unsaturated rhamnogalacturonyl hydrolase
MFAYAFAKGVQQGSLPDNYQQIAEGIFNAMLSEFTGINENGHYVISNICGGCGLGGNPYRDGSYAYYISEEQVVNDPKGVGAFILAAVELKN